MDDVWRQRAPCGLIGSGWASLNLTRAVAGPPPKGDLWDDCATQAGRGGRHRRAPPASDLGVGLAAGGGQSPSAEPQDALWTDRYSGILCRSVSPGVGQGYPATINMYADYFGFRELPFNNTPDPRFFYSTPDHEEALASLVYAVQERKGFVLLTGEIGAGKTLITRLMLRRFGAQIAFATIHHAVQRPEDLMESICLEFDLPTRPPITPTQRIRLLHDFLLAKFSQNLPVVLVLDEAQNLQVDGFEQLRMIGNLEAEDAKLLQIVIVGQPELQQTFQTPELRQLRQRIFRSFHLPALNPKATEAYIRHRLSVVSDDAADIFDADAIEAIHGHSRGLPRVINTLCDNALLSAYSADLRRIDRSLIESVMAQMLTLGDSGQAFPDDPHQGHAQDSTTTPDAVSAATKADAHPDQAVASTQMAQDAQVLNAGRVPESNWVDLDRRLTEFEQRLESVTQQTADARTLSRELASLLDQARVATDRAETAGAELQRRDAALRELEDTARSVTRHLEQLIDRAGEVSMGQNLAENRATAAHDRLVTQSNRSVAVANELTALLRRMVNGLPRHQSRTTSHDGASARQQQRRVGAITPPVSAPLKTVLLDTRADSADLRRLARNEPIGCAAHGRADHDPPG